VKTRLGSLFTAATAIAVPLTAACTADDGQLYDGEGVKSEDGKDDASALALFVDFTFEGEFTTTSAWNVRQSISDHLLYTIGQLNGANSVGRLDKLEVLEQRTASVDGKTVVTYKAKMPVAWGDKDDVPSTFELILPTGNDAAFLERFATSYSHSCVDFGAHDVDAGSMWYYYRPLRSGCSLASADVYRTSATVETSPINTTGKFPEYDMVWADGQLDVLAIFGKYEDGATTGSDAGIAAYNEFVASMKTELRNRGAVVSTPATIPTSPGVSQPAVSWVVTRPDGKTIKVDAFLTDNVTDDLNTNPAFIEAYERLSTRADFIVYNGHAGLGANIRSLARSGNWVAGQYVVVFMNGCDTYAYIDSALNDAHREVNPDDPNGTRYVDIVTNAMPSFFANMSGSTMALFRGLATETDPKTYEQIFRSISSSQVVLVSGEQDNTFVPGGGGGGGGAEPWAGLEASGTVRRNENKSYSTPVLAAGRYTFEMTGTRDADLYVRIGSAPTTTSFDCRPYKNGSNETCTVELPAAAKIFVMVRGWASSSEFELVGRAE
jgi:hypothetical protein